MRTWWLLAMVSVTPLFPGGGAEPRETSSTAGAVEWLVAEGLLAPEALAESTLIRQRVTLPPGGAVGFDPATNALAMLAAPAEPPALPPHDVGCQGVGFSFGFMSDPPGTSGVGDGCPFKIHRTAPHSSYLSCAAVDEGFSYCFLSATNIDFLNFGFYELFCFPEGALGFSTAHWQDPQFSKSTMNCGAWVFGSAALTWRFWTGFCGGSEDLGAWNCFDLLT